MQSWWYAFKSDFLHDKCGPDDYSLHNELNLPSLKLFMREDDGTKDYGSSLEVCVLLMGSHQHERIYWLLTYKLPPLFSQQ